MPAKTLPFTKGWIEAITADYPTPFHIYDERGIRENARGFREAFSRVPGFKNYFAVKATPNPYILEILREEGFGADCSSLPELKMASKVGITGEDIMFTSNDTPAEEYQEAGRLGAIINLDDISHIDFLEQCAGMPDLICFRYNPGPLRSREESKFIGNPAEAKYGFTREQLFEGYVRMKDKGVRRFGLHTMIVSNELDPGCFIETAGMLFDLVEEISDSVGIRFEFVNLGGGVGIPYKPEEEYVDLYVVSRGISQCYADRITSGRNHSLRVVMECGRMVTGPHGFLVTRVRHKKSTYKEYVGVDACMADLMRPGMYGAYHHITVLGKEDQPATHKCDVTGSLCENNDKFAVDRELPEIEIGDYLVIHDTGAHGRAMGFNYNGKLRSGELLLRPDGSVVMIRRPETEDDYFATFDFPGSRFRF